MEENRTLEFVAQRKNGDGEWVKVEELIWRIPPEEMAIAYSAHCIRKRCVGEAEKNLVGFIHQEPMRFGGKTRIVEFHSAGIQMKAPFLYNMTAEPGTPESMAELKTLIPKHDEWRTTKETGLQILASIGWLSDVTKARPPAITKDTSAVEYLEDLLPGNLAVKEDTAPSGYNKRQVAVLTESKMICAEALEKAGSLHGMLKEMLIVTYGERLFKTQSRIYGALPDPETEERAKFEAMRAAAAAKAEDDDD